MYFPEEYPKVMKMQRKNTFHSRCKLSDNDQCRRLDFFRRGQILRQKDQSCDLIEQSPSCYLFLSAPNFKNVFRLLALYYIYPEGNLTYFSEVKKI